MKIGLEITHTGVSRRSDPSPCSFLGRQCSATTKLVLWNSKRKRLDSYRLNVVPQFGILASGIGVINFPPISCNGKVVGPFGMLGFDQPVGTMVAIALTIGIKLTP